MPDTKYGRDTQRLECLGLDLNRPVDSVKPSRFPYMKNMRSYQNGRLEPRYGLTRLSNSMIGLGSTLHSARRLNDPNTATYLRILGINSSLYTGTATFTSQDSGYSGDPLALVPWRPEASPTSFMYVADRSRMRKINVSNGLHTVGLAAPTAPPTVGLTQALPSSKKVDDFESTTGWGQAGTAGAPTLLSAGPGRRVDTTITYIVFDSSTTGWACVSPAALAGFGPGELVIANSGGGTVEAFVVQSVFPGSTASTISRIIYDSGTSGLCSLVLATPLEQVACDALIRNTTATENARIVGVIQGPDGTTSIRVSTTGTWAATDAIAVLPTFRAYFAQTHAAAETLKDDGIRSAITVGTGTLTLTSALDLSLFFTGSAVRPEDFMVFSLRLSDPTLVTEIKVLLDVDATTNDFGHNYYWKSIRPSDLSYAAANLQPLLAADSTIAKNDVIETGVSAQQAELVDDSGQPVVPDPEPPPADPTSTELDPGTAQWADVWFRLSDLIRVGTDTSRTLKNVAVIRVTALVTGSINLDLGSWLIQGGFPPDTSDVTAIPYLYRYRARNPATNVPSNFSPASRYFMNPNRQSVTVGLTQYLPATGTSLATTDFVLDVERFGGQIAEWHYVGTAVNSATPSFVDVYGDDVVAGNPILGNDNYQPWPVISTPVSGTAGIIAGTTFNDSSTTFNMSWAPGTRILVNNQPFTIYHVISTSRMELVENAGAYASGLNIPWRIDEPVILAQPLPCLWIFNNAFFACGDLVNPGRLYHSNPDSETTRINNYIDVTSPSDPLMNGLEFNVRSYFFSSRDMFQLFSTSNPVSPYRFEKIIDGRGLFSRWFLIREPAPIMAFGSRDGIYISTGGPPISATDADLLSLFPNESNPGAPVNGISAPIVTSANAANLRLAYYDEYLYFDYLASDGNYATLALAFDLGAVSRGESAGGWFWDVYSPLSSIYPTCIFHYGEEGQGVHSLLVGGLTGYLYQYAGDNDDGNAFSCEFTTPSLDHGDLRDYKLYSGFMVDFDTGNRAVSVTPYFDNNQSSGPVATVTTTQRSQVDVPGGASAWKTARNISMYVQFNMS